MRSKNLNAAKKAKNDEFYTRLGDIEREARHYAKYFRGASVMCNCDDPARSQFVRYFVDNFERLGLLRLEATCHDGGDPGLFGERGKAVAFSLDADGRAARLLRGDGDFRSPEVVEGLRDADIVVTNPPFSLFRDFIAQLVEHGKKFLIVGNMNAVLYKDVFPLIRDGKLWLGVNSIKEFDKPDGSSQQFGNIRWFTNLEHDRRKERLPLRLPYDPADHPRYDNYDAIEVSRMEDIPRDHDGVMGVPITYIERHCPEQFEIVGSNRARGQDPRGVYGRSSFLGGKETFKRVFIRRRAGSAP